MTQEKIPLAFLAAVPKTDLHVHLDGSIRLTTLIDLALRYRVELPSYTEGGLRETVFKDTYQSLSEYLHGFTYSVAVLQHAEALEQCAYELAVDNQQEGVRYIEVRFAPQLHVNDHLDTVGVLCAVNKGLKRAKDIFNQRQEVKTGQEPAFEYGIICCAMRMFKANFSLYYANLIRVHRFSPPKEVYRLASLELARAAVIARDAYQVPVVGFDLAGEEAGYPASDHHESFAYAHKNFLKKTVHAGEAYGAESIFQAITDLHAERIGHGTYLLDSHSIMDPSVIDKQHYVEQIAQFIADRRITIEVCLTSNLQTNPSIQDISQHSFQALRAHRLSTTICTDNRTVSHTTLTRELHLAIESTNMDRREVKSVIIYGFKRSFFPGTYLRKRDYVRAAIDYYETIERQFFGNNVQGPSEPL